MGWHVVLWVGAAQSIFLAALLLAKRGGAAKWLAVLLFSIGWILADEALDLGRVRAPWPHGSSAGGELLLGPLVLFFVRALKGSERPAGYWQWLHLLPFLAGQAVIWGARFGGRLETVAEWMMTLKGPVMLLYLLVAWRTLSGHRGSWMVRASRYTLAGLIALGLVSLSLFYLGRLGLDLGVDSDRAAGLGLTLTLHAAAFAALRPGARRDWEKPEAAYATSPLNDAARAKLGKKVTTCLDRDRPWAQPDLTLSGLAEACRVPSHHLSEVLSTELGGNFYEVVARYRVAEACRLLEDGEWAHRTALDIAFEAGFNSKASFQRAFRRETGVTPSAFRKRPHDFPSHSPD